MKGFLWLCTCFCYSTLVENIYTISNSDANPLILTPLIENGKIAEARRKSKVNYAEFGNIRSFSGYLTVDKHFNSNIFFWYFPSQYNTHTNPVILWLQGGPGWSSLDGLFVEHGPFIVQKNGSINFREESWNKNHSVIYLDQPVGTGFSFTSGGYAENQTIIGDHVYIVLSQFFQLFPELKEQDFYIAGESYAGKYVPAVAYTIHKMNTIQNTGHKINLRGLLIGNGLVDPENQFVVYSDYLHQLGFVDSQQKKKLKEYEMKILNYIQSERYFNATNVVDKLIFGGKTSNPLIQSVTGFKSVFNYLKPFKTDFNWMEYVNDSKVRKAIHVGLTIFNDKEVERKLWSDITKSVKLWLIELLNHYRVMVYSGQLDIILAYPTTENYLRKLNFNGADEYKIAQRNIWMVESELAGYMKKAGNLTEVLIRDAGHMAPADKPKWCYDLLFKFVRNMF